LGRGNNAEAGRIWLSMTPDDRLNLAHSAGLNSSASLQNLANQPPQGTESTEDSGTRTPANLGTQTINFPNPPMPEDARDEP